MGKTLQEYDERLRKVFSKIRESGLKLKTVDCISGTLFRHKVLKLIPQKLKQLLKCPWQGQLMNYRGFLVWLIT